MYRVILTGRMGYSEIYVGFKREIVSSKKGTREKVASGQERGQRALTSWGLL